MNNINIADLGPEVSSDLEIMKPSKDYVWKWECLLELDGDFPRRLLNMEKDWYDLVHNYMHDDCYLGEQYYTCPAVDPKDYMEAAALLESVEEDIMSKCIDDQWCNPCRKLQYVIPQLRTRMTMVPCETPEGMLNEHQ